MDLPILKSHNVSLKEFIEYWGSFYSYNLEDLYDKCIQKPNYDKQDIQFLYVWKNGMKLSKLKQKSLDDKIISKLSLINDLNKKPLLDIRDYNSEFKDVSFVWRTFLMHIIKPYDLPMYDQNVHRAYNFIHGKDFGNISEVMKESVKESFYVTEYFPFVKKIEGLTIRQVDRGLFAFGQFIKNRSYIKFFE